MQANFRTATPAYIEGRNVNLTFRPPNRGPVRALSNFDIDIGEGEFLSIVGPSGCGKSTFLNVLLGLIKPDSGDLRMGGKPIAGPGSDRAMVFQEFGLLPWRTVQANVELGLELKGMAAEARRKVSQPLIEMIGLAGFESHFPHELSGGMKQRVGLARALSNNASILLMDEAYSALDPLIRTDMQTMLLELQTELKKTIVFITHDLDEALRLGDQIVILRDGSIIQQGDSQDILLRPADDYIERFVKDVNRGRFIKVDAVMEPAPQSETRSLPKLKSGTTLEVAAKELTNSSYDAAFVTADSGQPLGLISLRQITAALSSGSAA